jgi:putative sterol carrier protein
MSVFKSSGQLYKALKLTFERVQERYPETMRKVSSSRLIIRFRCRNPQAEITMDGRKNPVQFDYGEGKLRPDIDIELSGDVLNAILLGEVGLSKALGMGELKVKGPVWKAFVLQDVFQRGQTLYPAILEELDITP